MQCVGVWGCAVYGGGSGDWQGREWLAKIGIICLILNSQGRLDYLHHVRMCGFVGWDGVSMLSQCNTLADVLHLGERHDIK